MRILLSNDDGYFAPGLAALYEALGPLAQLTVVAPERDRSGASNSLTLDRPLSIRQAANGFFHVNGTPTDCVHMAVTGMLDFVPDMIVSGINSGANMGDDTIYSGTVAAATEGFLLGIPAIAISMVGSTHKHFETAAWVAAQLVARYQKNPIKTPMLLNVNVPDVPFSQLKGVRTVRLGKRHQAEPVVKSVNDQGITEYRVGPVGKAADAGSDTDFGTIAEGYASVTPLSIDLTKFDALHLVKAWLV